MDYTKNPLHYTVLHTHKQKKEIASEEKHLSCTVHILMEHQSTSAHEIRLYEQWEMKQCRITGRPAI